MNIYIFVMIGTDLKFLIFFNFQEINIFVKLYTITNYINYTNYITC